MCPFDPQVTIPISTEATILLPSLASGAAVQRGEKSAAEVSPPPPPQLDGVWQEGVAYVGCEGYSGGEDWGAQWREGACEARMKVVSGTYEFGTVF